MIRALFFAMLAAAAGGQNFEVASVKPSPDYAPAADYTKLDTARVGLRLPLQAVICMAYGVRVNQVAGPAWIAGTRYDIEAKLPAGATEDQIPSMLQALLANRFKMTMHRENREQPVYALVVDKRGLKMKAKAADAGAEPSPVQQGCGPRLRSGTNPAAEHVDYKLVSAREGDRVEASRMTTLVDFAALFVRLPLIDKTGLKGVYNIALDLPLTEGNPADPIGDVDPVIVSALEKLGLKLEPQRAAIETIVIDHIERIPTED